MTSVRILNVEDEHKGGPEKDDTREIEDSRP